MNTSILLRRVTLLLSGLVVLGLSACATPKPPTPTKQTTHKIVITYNAAATPQWSYSITPSQSDPKNARVKRGDIIQWVNADGAWTVYFKGPSPLGDPQDPCKADIPYVGAAAGAPAGAEVTDKVKKGDEFSYGVSVLLPNTTVPVVDDPRIFIEN
jgi:plastocyanin